MTCGSADLGIALAERKPATRTAAKNVSGGRLPPTSAVAACLASAATVAVDVAPAASAGAAPAASAGAAPAASAGARPEPLRGLRLRAGPFSFASRTVFLIVSAGMRVRALKIFVAKPKRCFDFVWRTGLKR